MVIVNCKTCGKKIDKKPSVVKNSKSKNFYCSLKCNGVTLGKRRKTRQTWTDKQLAEAIVSCDSFSDTAIKLGLSRSSNTLLRKRAKELNLDFSHFRISGHKPKPFEKLKARKNIKRRLLLNNDLKYECSECGIFEWRNKTLSLDLEHIDGNRNNNNKTNLTLLCPNCHSQTDTYRGKNRGKYAN